MTLKEKCILILRSFWLCEKRRSYQRPLKIEGNHAFFSAEIIRKLQFEKKAIHCYVF